MNSNKCKKMNRKSKRGKWCRAIPRQSGHALETALKLFEKQTDIDTMREEKLRSEKLTKNALKQQSALKQKAKAHFLTPLGGKEPFRPLEPELLERAKVLLLRQSQECFRKEKKATEGHRPLDRSRRLKRLDVTLGDGLLRPRPQAAGHIRCKRRCRKANSDVQIKSRQPCDRDERDQKKILGPGPEICGTSDNPPVPMVPSAQGHPEDPTHREPTAREASIWRATLYLHREVRKCLAHIPTDLVRREETATNHQVIIEEEILEKHRRYKKRRVTQTDEEVIPTFRPDEKSGNVKGWLHKIDQLGDVYGWNNKDRQFIMQIRLRGSARDWYEDLEDYDLIWTEWKDALETAPTKSRQEAVEAFKNSISFRDCTYAPAVVSPVSNNKIRVEFDTQAHDDAFTKLRSKPDAPVTAEPARKLKPMILLKRISSDMAPEDPTPKPATSHIH
ncbi:unnamed protein product [Danaus chrysippus]|uniref:(African queen) hypothetical protein n=1 Tax=Danaus chrysippus TaxID=151541 RepID=A0A8J2W0U9_9NEOP|nr:unnamed protein product [Danaus chrysippus]